MALSTVRAPRTRRDDHDDTAEQNTETAAAPRKPKNQAKLTAPKTKAATKAAKGAPKPTPQKSGAAARKPARTKKATEPKAPRVTKEQMVIQALCRPEGATITELMELTGWQNHSVRGFLSGTAKKKLGLMVERITEDGRTVYRVPSVPV